MVPTGFQGCDHSDSNPVSLKWCAPHYTPGVGRKSILEKKTNQERQEMKRDSCSIHSLILVSPLSASCDSGVSVVLSTELWKRTGCHSVARILAYPCLIGLLVVCVVCMSGHVHYIFWVKVILMKGQVA